MESQLAIEQLKTDLSDEHKAQLEEVAEANIAEMQAMLKEFEQGQLFLKSKISEKDQQYVFLLSLEGTHSSTLLQTQRSSRAVREA